MPAGQKRHSARRTHAIESSVPGTSIKCHIMAVRHRLSPCPPRVSRPVTHPSCAPGKQLPRLRTTSHPPSVHRPPHQDAAQSKRIVFRSRHHPCRAGERPSQATDQAGYVYSFRNIITRSRIATSGLTPIKAYLVGYNLVSAALWLNILLLTIAAVARKPAAPLIQQAGTLSKFFGITSIPNSASHAANALARLSNNYSYGHLGWWTKVTQSLAVLEIVHSALGWVRSPIATTAAQVFSRIYTVWGVVEAAPEVSMGT